MYTISSLEWVTIFCALFMLGVVNCRAQMIDEEEVRDIGSHLELFVDEYLIESMNGVTRELHSPQRENVAIRFDSPWDGPVSHKVTVFSDGPVYRMYYQGGPCDAVGRMVNTVTCYAESWDGVHWVKPNLDLYRDEYTGTTDNNIILWQTRQWRHATDNLAVFKDTNPNCPPEARYKAVGRTIKGELSPEESASGFGAALAGNLAFQSPDGIHWSLMQKEPIVVGDGFDSHNIAFWDAYAGCYREYHREFRDGYRDMMTSTSADFLHWTTPQWVEYGGAPQEHLYQGLRRGTARASLPGPSPPLFPSTTYSAGLPGPLCAQSQNPAFSSGRRDL